MSLPLDSRLPAFAKMAPSIAHAPSLFQSQPNGSRIEYVTLRYEVGSLSFRFVGPMLGPTELRVLQGLTAIAGWQNPATPFELPTDANALDRIDALLARSVKVTSTYADLARTIGYASNSGSVYAQIRTAIERLFAVSVFVGVTGNPSSKDLSAGHLLSELRSRELGGALQVGLSPILAAAVLGGKGTYLRLDMDEVRKLRTDRARLLHQRLHFINPGMKRPVGLNTLVGYVWPNEAESDEARRSREHRIRLALKELNEVLGWSVTKGEANLYTIGRPKPVLLQ
jgi:hypothetical protein